MSHAVFAQGWCGDFEEWDDEADRWFQGVARRMGRMFFEADPEKAEQLADVILSDRARFVQWETDTAFRPGYANGEFIINAEEVAVEVLRLRGPTVGPGPEQDRARFRRNLTEGHESHGGLLLGGEKWARMADAAMRIRASWARVCSACGEAFIPKEGNRHIHHPSIRLRCPDCRKTGRKALNQPKSSSSIEAILSSPSYEERRHAKA